VNYTVISLVFLAPFVGYGIAALLNNKVHMRFGQLGVAVIAPSCKITAYVIACVHPSDHFHARGVREWPRGRGVERLDWEHGECKRIAWISAWLLWSGSNDFPFGSYSNDNKGEPPLVHLLLSYGMHHFSF
jgi:hypothetical protein